MPVISNAEGRSYARAPVILTVNVEASDVDDETYDALSAGGSRESDSGGGPVVDGSHAICSRTHVRSAAPIIVRSLYEERMSALEGFICKALSFVNSLGTYIWHN